MSRPERMADAQRIVNVNMQSRANESMIYRYTLDVRERAAWWESLGEAPGTNNRGHAIDRMLHISTVGRRDKDGRSIGGPWCAVGASTMLVLAAGGDPRFVPFTVHRGAKRLVKNCGKAGSFIVTPQGWYKWGSYKGKVDAYDMNRALLIAWHRGFDPQTTWPGHVEIIVSYDPETDTLITWAPNVAPADAVRMELEERYGIELYSHQAVWHLRTHANGSWRRRLCCVATLEDLS